MPYIALLSLEFIQDLILVNRTEFRVPIYVGKAVPRGWRQARQSLSSNAKSYEFNNRIRGSKPYLEYKVIK